MQDIQGVLVEQPFWGVFVGMGKSTFAYALACSSNLCFVCVVLFSRDTSTIKHTPLISEGGTQKAYTVPCVEPLSSKVASQFSPVFVAWGQGKAPKC